MSTRLRGRFTLIIWPAFGNRRQIRSRSTVKSSSSADHLNFQNQKRAKSWNGCSRSTEKNGKTLSGHWVHGRSWRTGL